MCQELAKGMEHRQLGHQSRPRRPEATQGDGLRPGGAALRVATLLPSPAAWPGLQSSDAPVKPLRDSCPGHLASSGFLPGGR